MKILFFVSFMCSPVIICCMCVHVCSQAGCELIAADNAHVSEITEIMKNLKEKWMQLCSASSFKGLPSCMTITIMDFVLHLMS